MPQRPAGLAELGAAASTMKASRLQLINNKVVWLQDCLSYNVDDAGVGEPFALTNSLSCFHVSVLECRLKRCRLGV